MTKKIICKRKKNIKWNITVTLRLYGFSMVQGKGEVGEDPSDKQANNLYSIQFAIEYR